MKSSVAVKILIVVSLLLTSFTNYALRSSDYEAYTDPDFIDYRFSKVLLVVEGGFEVTKIVSERLGKELAKRNIELVEYNRIFSPTRDWTGESRSKALIENSVDAVLMISPGASAATIIPAMTQTYGTVSGNYNESSGAFSGTVRSSSNQLYSMRSQAEFAAVLFDVKTTRVAWYADILTKAGGAFFVGSKGDAKAVAKVILNALIENNHLDK